MNGPMVDIFVGKKAIHFRLPKDLLCKFSKYFDRCLNGPFIEGQTQRIDLTDVSPDHFRYIADWICRGIGPGFSWWEDSGNKGRKKCMAIVRLADRLDLLGACNVVSDHHEACIKEMVGKPKGGSKAFTPDIPIEDIELVFRALPPGHKIRVTIAQAVMRGMKFAFRHSIMRCSPEIGILAPCYAKKDADTKL
jgi:hypothetical protein